MKWLWSAVFFAFSLSVRAETVFLENEAFDVWVRTKNWLAWVNAQQGRLGEVVGDGRPHPAQMYNIQDSLEERFKDKNAGNFSDSLT